MRWSFIQQLLVLGCCSFTAMAGELDGTFTIQGEKGPITLTLSETAEGLDGKIADGTLQAKLRSFHVLWGDGSTGTWTYQMGGVPGNKRLFLKVQKKAADEWVQVR